MMLAGTGSYSVACVISDQSCRNEAAHFTLPLFHAFDAYSSSVQRSCNYLISCQG